MKKETLSYIAGFLEGDGCLMAQLIRRQDYVYGYQIRLSIVFYQKTKHRYFLEWLKSKLKLGYVRDRNDDMSEYTIVGLKEVASVLKLFLPYLRLKKRLAHLLMRISRLPQRPTPKELIRYAKLVDQSAGFNYSKKRTNRLETLLSFFKENHISP